MWHSQLEKALTIAKPPPTPAAGPKRAHFSTSLENAASICRHEYKHQGRCIRTKQGICCWLMAPVSYKKIPPGYLCSCTIQVQVHDTQYCTDTGTPTRANCLCPSVRPNRAQSLITCCGTCCLSLAVRQSPSKIRRRAPSRELCSVAKSTPQCATDSAS